MMIKGINALIDAKRASSFNNTIKLVNENVQITHDRLITLENRTAMMAKAIIPILKDFKQQINKTNNRLTRQYGMMTRAHERYNRLFMQGPSFTAHNSVEVLFVVSICIKLLGNVVRVYPRIVQGLTFLSA